MMKRWILIGSLLFMISCGPTRPGTSPSPLQASEHVLLLDRAHKSALKVVKYQNARLPNGQLEVALVIENRRDIDIWTDIQVVFKGSDGMEIEKTSWTPFMFHRREVSTFKTSSLGTQATDYTILIRKVH